MSAEDDFVRGLGEKVPEVGAYLAEHLEDNMGDVLPYVFLGTLEQELETLVGDDTGGHGSGTSVASAVIGELNRAVVGEHSDEIANLVAVGFLENIGDQSPLLPLLSPTLLSMRNQVLAGPQ